MARRPNVIKLGDRDIKVFVAPMEADYADANGTYDHDERELQIAPRAGRGEICVSIVLHELMHAFVSQSGLDERLGKKGDAAEIEEQLAWNFGNYLLELMKRNPGLIKWMQEVLHDEPGS